MPVRLPLQNGLSACHKVIRQAVFHGILMALTFMPFIATGQAPLDTLSKGYRIGYQIGSWLPFVVLAALFLWMLSILARKNQQSPPDL